MAAPFKTTAPYASNIVNRGSSAWEVLLQLYTKETHIYGYVRGVCSGKGSPPPPRIRALQVH